MQRFISLLAFVVITMFLQLSSTYAGSSSIIARVRDRDGPLTTYTSLRDEIQMGTGIGRNSELDEQSRGAANTEEHMKKNNDRRLDHEFKYEPKPNYKSYQPKSKMTKGQKIGLFSVLGATVALAIYSCVLRYELSSMNVYSLLGVHTSTQEEEEEKVGDAYGRKVEMI